MLEVPVFQTSLISLRLLREDDFEGLLRVSDSDAIWTWFSLELNDDIHMRQFILQMLSEYQKGTTIPFTIVELKTNSIIGSTSFLHMDENNRCLEIGTTWIGEEYWGTGINFHIKYAMLSHVFEEWGFHRVEFRTDALNIRSRRAIEKIGATYEGLLRSHRFNRFGKRRDTVIYSILASDWPDISQTNFNGIQYQVK